MTNETYFVGIYNESTLDLLPLFVRELDDVPYLMVFEEGVRLEDGSNWKKGFD
jgi:hypothetical protein